MESVGPHGLSLTKSDQLHFINILESTKPNNLWSWCFTGVSRSGRHIQNIFLPDISVVQQLPSISPCSRLLPVTSHPALIPHIILVVIWPHAVTVTCSWVLYLVGLQFICITGEPLDKVTRDHIAWATGERWVGWTSVLQLLPLPNAVHRPALPETGSGGEGALSSHPVSLSPESSSYWQSFLSSKVRLTVKLQTQVDKQTIHCQQDQTPKCTYFPHQKLLRFRPLWSIFINTESTSM